MISISDEKDHTWIFTEEDLSPNAFRALNNLGINKSETRIWREYVFSGFLNNPDSNVSLKRLESILAILGTKQEELNEHIATKQNDLVGHALMVYNTIVGMETRLARIKKEEERKSAKDTEITESGDSEE